ncbi:rhamnogalacturonan acetylesterase [Paenibacillus pasadenensis]|nr:rhamnogalacturonan acetylesterase [Paenibacillus pasadenensis]
MSGMEEEAARMNAELPDGEAGARQDGAAPVEGARRQSGEAPEASAAETPATGRGATELRFAFGPGEPPPGAAQVRADDAYSDERGWGFEPGSTVHERLRPGGEGILIPVQSVFAVAVPDGIYHVRVRCGDERHATSTSVRLGEGSLVLPLLERPAGVYAEELFAAAVRGGRLRLRLSGKAPRLCELTVTPAPQAVGLFLAGDSTVCDQPASGYPYFGWGQALPARFKHDVAVDNHAVSGRSSLSFIREGRLEAILERLKPGDWLFVQFGHNDQKNDAERFTEPFGSYKDTLRRYVSGARERQAHAVLVTSMQRRDFDAEGRLRDTHGDYPAAMRELAAEEGVPLIDLAELSRELFEAAGPEGTKDDFMWLLPGESLNHPSGTRDNTHFQERGAVRLAGLVAAEIRRLRLQPLAMYLRESAEDPGSI